MLKRYPSILQRDETDCGPAVLASLARFYKLSFSVARIRDIAGTDLEGTNLLGLSAHRIAAHPRKALQVFKSCDCTIFPVDCPR